MRLRDYYRLGKSVINTRFYHDTGRFSMPYKYSFVLTNVCQSQCKTCKIWKIYEDNPELQDEELELEEFKKIIDSISEDVLWLNFSGGEPFLFPHIVELAEYAFENCPNLFMMNIPTNAISNDFIAQQLEKILEVKPNHINLSVTISLDGLEGQHDKIRGVKGNWESAKSLFEDMQELEEKYKNFEAGFQTTVSKYNIGSLEEIYDYTRQASIPIFTFAHESYYFYNEGEGEEVENSADKQDLMKAIDYLYSEYEINKLKDLVPKIYLKLARKFYENPDEHVLPPSSGRGSITVDPYGNVKLFSYFSSEMGSLREHDYDFESVLKSEKAQEELEKIDNNEGEIYWVNCEAYPTIFQHPVKALKKAYL